MLKSTLFLLLSLVIFTGLFHTISHARSQHKAGDFAYYTMALSWSPTYCSNLRTERFEPQCDGTRRYAFVLHGLWPQYERGWPSYCRVRNTWVPEEVIRSMLDIMPSKRLVIHQWRKHGVCSGLDVNAFFALSRKAFQAIKIPARYISPQKPIMITPKEIEADFLKTNDNLTSDMIAVSCGRRKRLRELRICFDKKLNPTACGLNENQRKLCRTTDRLVMPPVR